jgi:transposase-like protein
MPAERTFMRQVREVLRLKFVGGVPIREIARRVGVAASTVRATIKRFQAAGLTWPLPDELTDAALEAKLFADAGTKQGHRRQVEPDWASIHRELKRKHVTLSILCFPKIISGRNGGADRTRSGWRQWRRSAAPPG